jgi:hypothetical protein
LTRTGCAKIGRIEVTASASAAAHKIFTAVLRFIICSVLCAFVLACIIDQIEAHLCA